MKSKENQLVIGRRSALKMLGLGSAGMLAGGFTDIKASEPADMGPKPKQLVTAGNSSVAFTTGSDRQQMLFEVVKPFESEIKKGLKGKQLVIKPNMVVTNTALCATHPDALRALLEYLKPIYKGQIIIAESSSNPDSAAGFKEYGYLDVAKEYNVKFIDLNTTKGKPFYVLDRNLHMDKMFVSELFLDPANYFISISRLKTHNTVVMTGGVKNMVMAAPLNLPAASAGERPINYKRNMHSGGPRWLHYNMYLMAQAVRPDFTIIDGVEGMEGNGPIAGTPVNHKIALAGQDVVAIDSMCARMMGIPLENVGYLNYCEAGGLGNVDRNKIDIIGSAKPEDNVITYKLSSNAAYQLEWKDPLNLPQNGPQMGPRPQQGQAPAQPQRN